MIADPTVRLPYLIFRSHHYARTVTEDRRAEGVWLVYKSVLGDT